MTGGLSVNGISNLRLNDPYLIQALSYQSPYAQGLNTQNVVTQTGTQPAGTTPQGQVNFNGTPSAEQNIQGMQKKKSKAWLVLTGVALTGLGILFHKKGNANLSFFERIKDGAKVSYNNLFAKLQK